MSTKIADNKGNLYDLKDVAQVEMLRKDSNKLHAGWFGIAVVLCFPLVFIFAFWNLTFGKENYQIVLTNKDGEDTVATVDDKTFSKIQRLFNKA